MVAFRSGVNGSFSAFKMIFGESVMSRNWQNVVNGVMAKAAIYNTMIDMAQKRGCLHDTAPAGSGERAGEGYGQGGGGKTGDLAAPHRQMRGITEQSLLYFAFKYKPRHAQPCLKHRNTDDDSVRRSC